MIFMTSLNWAVLIQSMNKRDNRVLVLSAAAILGALFFVELSSSHLRLVNSFRLMNLVGILGALLILFYTRIWNS